VVLKAKTGVSWPCGVILNIAPALLLPALKAVP
jgi:hypothetical protein